MMSKILLVGAGNMGFAMLKGWREKGSALEIHVIEPDEALCARAAQVCDRAVSKAQDLGGGLHFDVVVLAVKPQILRSVLPAFRAMADAGATFLSVAAGIAIETLAAGLGERAAIIRCMPNTPASIGAGMIGCFANSNVSAAMHDLAARLLATSGEVVFVDHESEMDAITAVSGSGPAYVFYFIECLIEAGRRAGLTSELAEKLAIQTVVGASQLAKASEAKPAVLREQVTSPNGTTAAGLNVLMASHKLENLVIDTVDAARRRSVELR